MCRTYVAVTGSMCSRHQNQTIFFSSLFSSSFTCDFTTPPLSCQHNNLNAGPLLSVVYCQPTESNLSFWWHRKEEDPIQISTPFNMCGWLTFAFHLSASQGEKTHCKSLLHYSSSMAEQGDHCRNERRSRDRGDQDLLFGAMRCYTCLYGW